MFPSAVSGSSEQLLDQIQRLEARIAQLESVLVLRGATVRLQFGGSSIDLGAKGVEIYSTETLQLLCSDTVIKMDPSGMRINSREIEMNSAEKVIIKASGDLVLKGSRILEN